MNDSTKNTLVAAAALILVAGAGYYVTEVRQPAEVQHIKDAMKVARLREAKVTELLAEQATSAEQADAAVRKWRARYKYIPAEMSTPDIVEYLKGLTARGFERFDIALSGVQVKPDFKYYTFSIDGTAFFTSLYRFVWHIENNRKFYRIRNLRLSHTNVFKENEETGKRRRLDMVSFSMELDALFAGTEGLSRPIKKEIPLPEGLMPARRPAHNSFYPVLRTSLPPNDELLVEVEKATLLSIVGNRAIFEDARGQHVLEEGDAVYLGTIVEIDPANSVVTARLNKGGIVETVDIHLTEDAFYEQAKGRTSLDAIDAELTVEEILEILRRVSEERKQ